MAGLVAGVLLSYDRTRNPIENLNPIVKAVTWTGPEKAVPALHLHSFAEKTWMYRLVSEKKDMGNTPSKLIATVEVELQIIDNLNDYLFKILWN